jgi:hypothetical protein
MIRQFQQAKILSLRCADRAPIAATAQPQRLTRAGTVRAAVPTVRFPRRPDARVLSESIPLYFIARNRHGFWVAREADGRAGGLFLRQRAAIGFAVRNSEPSGCATMVLKEIVELDVENEGSRLVAQLAVAVATVTRRAPNVAGFVGSMIAEWRKLVAQVSSALASERRHRAALETELFHGQCILSSKNDDDLPIA